MQNTPVTNFRLLPFAALNLLRSPWNGWLSLMVVMAGLLVLPVAQAANFPGVGTYTQLKTNSGKYIGGPGTVGLYAHAQQFGANPGITWRIDNGSSAGYYTFTNITNGRCMAIGDGTYENTRGSNSSAGYVVELSTCDYSNVHLQFQIADNGSGVSIRSAFDYWTTRSWCDDGSGSDVWMRDSCGVSGAVITLGGYSAFPNHIQLSQADSTAVPPDNTTLKTITVTSCSNAGASSCTTLATDTQTVTISNLGVGTMNSSSITLVGGVGSFTVKSGVVGNAQLKVTASTATAGYSCSRGGSATTGTDTNADCQVNFNSVPDHIQLSQDDTTTRLANNTSTKTVTVSSCSNAMGSACTLLATDTQTVTLANTGVGTLSAASVTLVGGQATFTVKSNAPGDAKLAPSATVTNSYTCTRAGTSGAQTVGAADNIDCMVSFLPPHHIQLSQADSSPVLNDGTTTKTVTVTSCSNSNFDTCTTLMGDTQTVTIANVVPPGVGTLSTTSVPLVNGVGTFTVSSLVVGNAQLKVTASTATATPGPAYSCTRGSPATQGSDSNVDCQVTFGTGTTFDAVEHIQSSPPTLPAVRRLFTKIAVENSDTDPTHFFNFDVVAISSSAINTSYNGTVDVELMDASGGGCGSYGDPATKLATVASSYTFTIGASQDNGRHKFSAYYNKTVKSARVRIKSGAQTYCSTDSFSIRPAYYELASTPGSGSTVVAGDAFSITATLKNATGTTITDVPGAPTLKPGGVTDWTTTAIPTGSLTGGFDAMVNGVATGNLFKYTDIGPLSFTSFSGGLSGVFDSTFMDGTSDKTNTPPDCLVGSNSNAPDVDGRIGCDIGSAALTTARFIPHHYAVTTSFTPSCGSFTYMGQSLGIAAEISVKNSNGNTMTRVLSGPVVPTGWTMPSVVSVIASDTTATPLNSSLTGFPAPPPAAAPSWPSYATLGTAPPSGGVATISSGSHQFDRPVATSGSPPYYNAFRLTSTISDPDGQRITACPSTITDIDTTKSSCASSTTSLRYGILKIENAYGSELLDLPVAVLALFWNGSSWRQNTDDSCTSINPAAIVIGNRKGQLSASNLPVGNLPTNALPLVSGKALLMVRKPNPSATGTADLAINLGATGGDASCTQPVLAATSGNNLSWLRGKWCGGLGYTQDPSTRIGFGVSKSPFLYRREKY